MLLLLISNLLFAGSNKLVELKEQTNYVATDKTEIDFEGLEIEGELVKPQGALIQERTGTKFNPLVKLKTDFTYEIKNSVNEIK